MSGYTSEGSSRSRRNASEIGVLSPGFVSQQASATAQAFSYDTPLNSVGVFLGRSCLLYTASRMAISLVRWEKGGDPVMTYHIDR